MASRRYENNGTLPKLTIGVNYKGNSLFHITDDVHMYIARCLLGYPKGFG